MGGLLGSIYREPSGIWIRVGGGYTKERAAQWQRNWDDFS